MAQMNIVQVQNGENIVEEEKINIEEKNIILMQQPPLEVISDKKIMEQPNYDYPAN